MDRITKTKLHEAIEQVLSKSGHSLASIELADKINSLNLYHRKDGRPVPASQISARANNYTSLFDIRDGRVFLKKFKS